MECIHVLYLRIVIFGENMSTGHVCKFVNRTSVQINRSGFTKGCWFYLITSIVDPHGGSPYFEYNPFVTYIGKNTRLFTYQMVVLFTSNLEILFMYFITIIFLPSLVNLF